MTRFFVIALFTLITLSANTKACEFNKSWQRSDGPVLRSPMYTIPIINIGYEAAGDPHVFQTSGDKWRMIYSADDNDQSSIKLATRDENNIWKEGPVLLGPSAGHEKPHSKETSFYRKAANGEHQIYFIGYEDEETYESEIYLAVSKKFSGPYQIFPQPIVRRGKIAERNVYLITSPSVVEHNGILHMTFLGWNGLHDVTEVWAFGATSNDNGRSWSNLKEIEAPIGMEGQITKTPYGQYAAVRTGEYGDTEALFIACSNHPFGPYTHQEKPVLVKVGKPWEVDEIMAPSLVYDNMTKKPTLYYTGANHKKGWWIMSATPSDKSNPSE